MPLVTHDSRPPVISVVVPSYNSARTIERCLASLVDQQCDADYEVIVVDSSNDNTPQIIGEQFPEIQLIHLPVKTLPGAGRNIGVQQARGGIIACTDADCVADADWLQAHVDRQQQWKVVGGALGNANPRCLVGWASYLSEFSEFTPARRQGSSSNLITANVSYRREIFDTDRFDEDLFPGEDRLFHHRLAQRVPCLVDRTIGVQHINRSKISEFLRHQQRLGQSAAQARRRAELPGAILLRHPILALLTPAVRTFSMFRRLALHTPSMLLPALVTLPLILLGSVAWAWAFYREARLAKGQGVKRQSTPVTLS